MAVPDAIDVTGDEMIGSVAEDFVDQQGFSRATTGLGQAAKREFGGSGRVVEPAGE